MTPIGPKSAATRLAKIDGRTQLAKRAKSIRTALIEHVGGNPSPTQTILIDQAVMLQMRLDIMDRKALEAFIDAAGGSGQDSMTMAIAYANGDEGPALAALRERRPPFSPDDVVKEFTDLMRDYGIRSAESDKWGGDWVGEAFRKKGINVTPSAKPKSDLYREALPLLNAKRCSLLDNPRLISQLCALERRTARGGRDSIDHPPNGHDDVCNAAVGALLLVPKRRTVELMRVVGF